MQKEISKAKQIIRKDGFMPIAVEYFFNGVIVRDRIVSDFSNIVLRMIECKESLTSFIVHFPCQQVKYAINMFQLRLQIIYIDF